MGEACCGGGAEHSHKHSTGHNDPLAEQFINDVVLNPKTSGSIIKVKEAVEVGAKAVEYFRGSDFTRFVNKNPQLMRERHGEFLKSCGVTEENIENCAAILGQKLLSIQFIVRAEHTPLSMTDQDREKIEAKIPSHLRDNPKWPRRLGITKDKQLFDAQGFYIILYEKRTAFTNILLAAIIGIVLIACLFPIWPFKMKICVWYLGVILSTLLLVLIVVRLILFLACWFAGCDFWLFPNLFDEDAGVIDSFIPTYSFEKRKDDVLMIGARLFGALLTVGCFYKLSEIHSLSDVGNVSSKAFLDILEWGHQKLADTPANDDSIRLRDAKTPEEIEKIHWERCVQHCEFQDFDEFKDFCLGDCSCMEELWASKCWKACEPTIQNKLKQGKKDCRWIESENDSGTNDSGTDPSDDQGEDFVEEVDFEGEADTEAIQQKEEL